MGVLNVTPDSFSDGGRYRAPGAAVKRAVRMASQGADIIDVGGESTRPGSAGVDEREELRRVVPVIERLARQINIPISVDTRKPGVARAAVKAGASIINDVSGLAGGAELARIAAKEKAAIILMHMRGAPADMQRRPVYSDVISEIGSFLAGAARLAERSGVSRGRIVIDPGIGFGKTVSHNLSIINRLGELTALGYPVCVGVSRKSFIGGILGVKDPLDRIAGTLAASVLAIAGGADIIRVHDVLEAVMAARVADSIIMERAV